MCTETVKFCNLACTFITLIKLWRQTSNLSDNLGLIKALKLNAALFWDMQNYLDSSDYVTQFLSN